jgi:SAM-dependent methyltransferase
MFDNFNVIDTIPDQVLFDIRNSIIGDEATYTRDIERYIPELERVKKEIRAGSFLDIGCGRGEILQIFKRLLPQKKNYGIDELRLYVKICQSKKLPVMWMNPVEKLGYVQGSFKAITCIHQLQYMYVGFIYTFLRLARMRLRRGGILILQIPNSENVSEVTKWKNDPRYINAYSAFLIEYILRYVGFFAVEVQPHEDGKNITIIATRKPYPQPI